MSEPVLLIVRVGFLVLLWFFIFSIVYALRSDLFGAPVRKLRGDKSAPAAAPVVAAAAAGTAPVTSPVAGHAAPPSPQHPTAPSMGTMPTAGATGPARSLVITSGIANGTAIPLDDDLVTIGRSSDSTLVIVDEYTSTYHARLAKNGTDWVLTDLDSTNGTRLAGEPVRKPVRVPLFTPVTIGQTSFELRP